MKTLFLPLKKEWYNLIESGIKTEEYREIKKHWISRLCVHEDGRPITRAYANYLEHNISSLCTAIHCEVLRFSRYTQVRFSYGYTRRTMTYKIESITIGIGSPRWGAPAKPVFIIKLGFQESSETKL